MVIISVSQGYESTEKQQDYQTETRTTYRERSVPMDIRKAKDNFDKDGRPKYSNYNIYEHIAKDCKKPKKKQDTKKYYKCEKIEQITKDCRSGQNIKN